jgi:hypothetical protein
MMFGLLGQFVLDSNHFPFLRVLFGRHLSLVGDSLYPLLRATGRCVCARPCRFFVRRAGVWRYPILLATCLFGDFRDLDVFICVEDEKRSSFAEAINTKDVQSTSLAL